MQATSSGPLNMCTSQSSDNHDVCTKSCRRGSQAALDTSILYFSRLVLGVQLVLAGVQLPSRYLKTQWRPLSILLGPIMVAMWLTTSLLVWALVPDIPFLHALAIGSCVTPTVSNNAGLWDVVSQGILLLISMCSISLERRDFFGP